MRIGWAKAMVTPATAFPSVLRAAKPTMRPEIPAEASSPAERTRSSGNCERLMEMATIQMTASRIRRLICSRVADSGSSVPLARWCSMLRRMIELTRRVRIAAMTSIRRTMTRLRGLRSPTISRINDVARDGLVWARSNTGREARNAGSRRQGGVR